MEFALHYPKAPLDRHVESLTFYAGFSPAHDREKLIPDGAIQIVVDLTETPKKLYAGETSPVGVDFRKSWIAGMQQRWIVIEAQPGSSMMVIRFRPGGALAFVRHDAAALRGAVYPLEDVLNATAAVSLRDRVLAAPTAGQKFAAAEAWLLEQAVGGLPLHPTAARLAALLSRPGYRVRDAVAATGFSERHVLGLFNRWIGVGPKAYARIARFQGVLAMLARSGRAEPGMTAPPLDAPDWAQVAAETGYADQSHLSHEFQAFAGTTPGAYVAAYAGLTNYLPITLPK